MLTDDIRALLAESRDDFGPLDVRDLYRDLRPQGVTVSDVLRALADLWDSDSLRLTPQGFILR